MSKNRISKMIDKFSSRLEAEPIQSLETKVVRNLDNENEILIYKDPRQIGKAALCLEDVRRSEVFGEDYPSIIYQFNPLPTKNKKN